MSVGDQLKILIRRERVGRGWANKKIDEVIVPIGKCYIVKVWLIVGVGGNFRCRAINKVKNDGRRGWRAGP